MGRWRRRHKLPTWRWQVALSVCELPVQGSENPAGLLNEGSFNTLTQKKSSQKNYYSQILEMGARRKRMGLWEPGDGRACLSGPGRRWEQGSQHWVLTSSSLSGCFPRQPRKSNQELQKPKARSSWSKYAAPGVSRAGRGSAAQPAPQVAVFSTYLAIHLIFDKNAKCYISWHNYSHITSFNFLIFKCGDFILFTFPSLFCPLSFCQLSYCTLWFSALTARLLSLLCSSSDTTLVCSGTSDLTSSFPAKSMLPRSHFMNFLFCSALPLMLILSYLESFCLGCNLCFLYFFPLVKYVFLLSWFH